MLTQGAELFKEKGGLTAFNDINGIVPFTQIEAIIGQGAQGFFQNCGVVGIGNGLHGPFLGSGRGDEPLLFICHGVTAHAQIGHDAFGGSQKFEGLGLYDATYAKTHAFAYAFTHLSREE